MSALLDELALLDHERRSALRADDARLIGGLGYRWPVVDAKTHPAKAKRPSLERRNGPRASRFSDLEGTQ